MRHLYTSICNYCFPSNNSISKTIVSTIDIVAEMSGHSVEMHEAYYSSDIDKETLFETYHKMLGSLASYTSKEATRTIQIVTQDQLDLTLKVIYGTNGNVLSSLQRDLI